MKVMFRLFCMFFIVLLCAAGCSNKEAEKTKAPPQNISAVADKTTLLATIADDEKPQSITPASGLGMHAPIPAAFQFIFSERGGGVAYIVEKAGMSHVVHNGKIGKPYKTVGTVVLSPDGHRIAYGAIVDGKWYMVIDGKEGAPFNTVKSPLFSQDGQHIVYQAMAGDRWHLVVDTEPNAGTLKRYLKHEFNADSSKIAYIDEVDDKDMGRLVVCDRTFRNPVIVESKVSKMFLNTEKTRIAAVISVDNKKSVIEFSFDNPAAVIKGPLTDVVQNLVFGPDGNTLAYYVERSDKKMVAFNGKEEILPIGNLSGSLVISPDKRTVAAFVASGNKVAMRQFFRDNGQTGKEYNEAEGLVYSSEGRFYAYAARNGENWFVVVNGKEGPAFDRVVTPKFSPDGKFLVYRARKAGKRFVVVADTTGRTIKTHPTYEQVFDVVFTADGKSTAYGVKDGQKLIWKVEKL